MAPSKPREGRPGVFCTNYQRKLLAATATALLPWSDVLYGGQSTWPSAHSADSAALTNQSPISPLNEAQKFINLIEINQQIILRRAACRRRDDRGDGRAMPIAVTFHYSVFEIF